MFLDAVPIEQPSLDPCSSHQASCRRACALRAVRLARKAYCSHARTNSEINRPTARISVLYARLFAEGERDRRMSELDASSILRGVPAAVRMYTGNPESVVCDVFVVAYRRWAIAS